jgi:hypothetical protein
MHVAEPIHPFPNGNGRWSRLMADIRIAKLGGRRLTWEEALSGGADKTRKTYIDALKAAESGLRSATYFFMIIALLPTNLAIVTRLIRCHTIKSTITCPNSSFGISPTTGRASEFTISGLGERSRTAIWTISVTGTISMESNQPSSTRSGASKVRRLKLSSDAFLSTGHAHPDFLLIIW